MAEDSNVYHHTMPAAPTVNMGVERNSRGYNWSVTVVGAESPAAALAMIAEGEAALRLAYGEREGAEA